MERPRLLFVTRDYSKWVDRNIDYLVNELGLITDLTLIHRTGEIHDVLSCLSKAPDFILIHEDSYPYMTGLSTLDIPFGIIMYDIHYQIEERTRFILDNNIQHIFSHYRDKFHEWYPQLSHRMKWLPLYANTKIFRDYRLPKEINCLMIGKTGWGYYPLRNKMLDVLKDRPDFIYHDHPGYRNIEESENDEVYVGERYAREINRAKIFLTCGLIYEYPIVKYYEVLACNTLLLAPESIELLDLGFIPGQHFVSVDETNFAEKIEYYLAHESERKEIAARGYEMVHAKHSLTQRAGELVQMIVEILN